MHETEAKWNLEKCYGALRPSIGMIKLKFPKKKKKIGEIYRINQP